MVLLSKYFVVFKLAQWVVVAPGKSRRLPPTVTRTRFNLALVGRNGGDHLGISDFAVIGNGLFGNK